MCRSEILWHIGLQKKSVFYKNRANSISLTPNPFPVVKGCVCFVGSASCRAFGHTRPASVPGLSVGLPPSPRLGLRPKPHFQKLYRFIDSLSRRKTVCLNNHRTSQFKMPKTDILAKSLSILSQAVSSELSLPVSPPPKSSCNASNIANFIS